MSRAEYVLAHLPRLLRELEEARYIALHGTSRGEAFARASPSSGLPKDPTGKKAMLLLQLAEHERVLRRVLSFVLALSDDEKRTVIKKWRTPWLGWSARLRRWSLSDMKIWLNVVERLEKVLESHDREKQSPFAGGAAG